ncbi:MAG: prepilin peptidase [Pseudomonadota bacterium]
MIQTLILTLFPVLIIIAAIGDFLTMKIPNWLNILVGTSFFAAAFYVGMPLEQIGWHVAAGVIVLIVGFGLFAGGLIGGGDAKLLAVAAMWLGMEQLIMFLVVMSIAGGVLAVAMKLWWWVKLEADLRGFKWFKSTVKSSIDLPYGVAIAVGALFAFRHSWWLEPANTQLLG